jgi:hypothetical protein
MGVAIMDKNPRNIELTYLLDPVDDKLPVHEQFFEPFTQLIHPNLLIVEGKGDAIVIQKIAKQLGLEKLHIQSIQGLPKLKPFLEDLMMAQETLSGSSVQLTTLGIIRDADDNHSKAVQSVSSLLSTIVKNTAVKTGYLVLPHNDTGSLETLLLTTYDKPTLDKVDAFLSQFNIPPEKEITRNHVDKRRMQALLAGLTSQHPKKPHFEPIPSVSAGANHYLWKPYNHEAFAPLKAFLSELFTQPEGATA